MAEGKMLIKPSTTILISNDEDRIAAETLQREIYDRTGDEAVRSISRPPLRKNDGTYFAGRLRRPRLPLLSRVAGP